MPASADDAGLLGGGGAVCSPVSGVAEHGVISISGGRKGTHYAGVVPDGVTRVRFTPDGGKPAQSLVRDNFFELRVPEHGPTIAVHPQRGRKRPKDMSDMINGPVGPATGRLEWFDAEGKVVGPAEPSRP